MLNYREFEREVPMSIASLTPRWFEEQYERVSQSLAVAETQQPLRSLIAEERDQTETVQAAFDQLFTNGVTTELVALPPLAWRLGCNLLRFYSALRRRHSRRAFYWCLLPFFDAELRHYKVEINTRIGQLSTLLQTVSLLKPEWGLELPPNLEEIVWTVRISPLAYLRAMWNLFWSAIRHPLSETTIDLSTGRVLYRT